MSASTIERPNGVSPALEDSIDLVSGMAEKASEKVEQTKGWFRRALEWVGDKAQKAWNWFTGTVSGGAKWIKDRAIDTFNWSRVNGKKAWAKVKDFATRAWNVGWEWLQWGWDHGVSAVLWLSKPARIVLGSVMGLTLFAAIGAPVLGTAAIALAVFSLLKFPKTEEQKYAEELASKDKFEMNTAQSEEIRKYIGDATLEYQTKVAEHQASGSTSAMNPYLAGVYQGKALVVEARQSGLNISKEKILEQLEEKLRVMGKTEPTFVRGAKDGMRAALSEIGKIMYKHRDHKEQVAV